MEIREIDIPQLDILVLPVHNWSQSPPIALPIYPPITSQVGIPIIDMPGCVQSHRDSDENVQLTQEDERGLSHYVIQEYQPLILFNMMHLDCR